MLYPFLFVFYWENMLTILVVLFDQHLPNNLSVMSKQHESLNKKDLVNGKRSQTRQR
jgi:hypothetical protein